MQRWKLSAEVEPMCRAGTYVQRWKLSAEAEAKCRGERACHLYLSVFTLHYRKVTKHIRKDDVVPMTRSLITPTVLD